jgi:hypothetical protein
MKFVPYDLGIWFSRIDVNVLSALDADKLSVFDVSSDTGLEKMVGEWIAPWFAAHDEQNKREMRELLSFSLTWSDTEIEQVFSDFACAAKGGLDGPRLLIALRKSFSD